MLPRSTRTTGLTAALATPLLLATSQPATTPQEPPTGPGDIPEIVADMSVEELIGQMTWAPVHGTEADEVNDGNVARYGVETPAEVVEKFHLGGVLYFSWAGNTEGPEQVARLSNGLQQAALSDQGPGIPLATTIDQEGGSIARITAPATELPGNMALGATFDDDLAYEQGALLGEEMAAMGINVDFAPVLDVNTNPDNPVIGVRSMGEDPQQVADLGTAQIAGLQDAGTAAAAKHFPGHGDTDTDSHTGLPVITDDRQSLEKHLQPFDAAIDSGVDIIMSAHIIVDALDAHMPGTLSPDVLTGLLREDMNFDGLITTDALDMDALKELPDNPLDDGDIAVLAIQAGSDILLNSPDVPASIEAIAQSIDDGDLDRERLEDSVRRILQWKVDRGIWQEPMTDVDAVMNTVGSNDHVATATDIAQRGITLLRNTNETLPLDENTTVLVAGTQGARPKELAEQLETVGLAVTTELPPGPEAGIEYGQAVSNRAGQADVIVLAVEAARSEELQQAILQEVTTADVPAVVVLSGTPYDYEAVPDGASSVIATYGSGEPNLQAAARAISGTEGISGQLPVNVAGAPDATDLEIGDGIPLGDQPTNSPSTTRESSDLTPSSSAGPTASVDSDEADRAITPWLITGLAAVVLLVGVGLIANRRRRARHGGDA